MNKPNILDNFRVRVAEYIDSSYPEEWRCYRREAMKTYAMELLDKWEQGHGKCAYPGMYPPWNGKKTWAEYRHDGLAPIGDKYIHDEFADWMDKDTLTKWSDEIFLEVVIVIQEVKLKLMAERRAAKHNIG